MALELEKYASFFVRIWQEPRDREGARPEWRGSIEHVQSGQKRYFKDVEALVNFIESAIGEWDNSRSQRRYIA
jgi:hypothetical protein